MYLYLRKIVGILSSPTLAKGQVEEVKEVIVDHNKLYVVLFGKLKPKMHFLLHYYRLICLNGPVFHYSAMKFERKNQKLKENAIGTCSNINSLFTIALRHQLRQAYSLTFVKNSFTDFETGPVYKSNANLELKQIFPGFPEHTTVQSLKNVVILGKNYIVGSIFVFEFTAHGPRFGLIQNIFKCEDEVYFQATEVEVTSFNKHYYAYRGYIDYSVFLININNVIRTSPC